MHDGAPDALPENGMATALRLEYRLDEHIPLTVGLPYRHVERWEVAVLADRTCPDERPVEIGYAHVLVFNLEPGDNIGDFADRASGTWIDKTTAGLVPGRLVGEADNDEERLTGHVLLLDRVWLHPDHRGRGLGPIVAAAVI